jgi:hypothetical protein
LSVRLRPAYAADLATSGGSLALAADMRLRAAQKLLDEGRREEADNQLQEALAFYRSVGATRYIRQAEALAASNPLGTASSSS